MPIFDAPVAWNEKYIERRSYYTAIATTLAGVEHRARLRARSRVSLEYTVHLDGDDQFKRYHSFLYDYGNYGIALPLWTEYATLTSDAPANTTVLYTSDTSSRPFKVGSSVLVQASNSAHQIIALSTNSLILDTPLPSACPQGSRVYPLALGYLRKELSGQDIVRDYRVLSVACDIAPEYDWTSCCVYTGPRFQGAPLWISDHDYSSDREVTYIYPTVQTVDYNVGRIVRRTFNVTKQRWRERAVLLTRSEIETLRAFLEVCKGRASSCYFAPRREEYALARIIGANESTIDLIGYAPPARVGAGLILFAPDGTQIIRAVTNVASGPYITNVALSGSVGTTLYPETTRVSSIYKARLDADEIEIAFETDDIAIVELPFIEV